MIYLTTYYFQTTNASHLHQKILPPMFRQHGFCLKIVSKILPAIYLRQLTSSWAENAKSLYFTYNYIISYLKVRGVIWIFISLMRMVFCYQAESLSLRLDNKTPFSSN
jgi:hypothetical protein